MNDRKYILIAKERLDLLEELVDEASTIVGELKYNSVGFVSLPYWIAPKPRPHNIMDSPTDEELKDIF